MTIKSSKKNKNPHITIHNGVVKKTILIPYFEEGVSAGFAELEHVQHVLGKLLQVVLINQIKVSWMMTN